ncbi:nuclear transport factor 2 family protein [Caldimonas tepidiphila]|uniref:nuclear transport factor 2 family protein n=1 Tax=Caldimonas tepidiphila TaxID=2315841 RepID=UPI000E5A66A7|nr:nuclear transport factor 2 family protein [Caldimonas tepidiphila]
MPLPSQEIEPLIDSYCSAWSEPDGAAREETLSRVWAEGARYTDPLVDASDTHELAEMIGEVQSRHPGSRYERCTPIDAHHGYARFGWRHVAPDGSTVREGYDFVEVGDDRRIRRIVGFFGPATGA